MSQVGISRRSIGARPNPEAAAAILDTAARILAEKGLKGLTTEAIAREARASKSTLYRWWPSRGALLLAVYMRMKQDHGYADTGSLIGDVAVSLSNLFAFWRGNGSVFALIIAEAQTDKTLLPALDSFREERVGEWKEVLERAQVRGELRAGADLRALAESIIAHAWFHLLTARLHVDMNRLAFDIVHPYLKSPHRIAGGQNT
ncbi:TetR/AcrR family transcriptional regulator [Rhizobium sp. CFBP 8762]|uniref:TetR/AcrR family transcriptional regulator n=1 Tax=Rhizobium sp. CFBP 8762 TaxID=2775279 RepID=UPI00178270DF|nr:TetR/AcrR family transcriptional regulator [Rhizobium sp. CFBP 8762]MBD8556050.1 TetR/AcrR family transcriptional regulator [Rhizobium sp. CFBP 8762]